MSAISNGKEPYIIFLDIDGVLLSDWEKHQASHYPSKEGIEAANQHESYLRLHSNSYSNNYWSLVIAHHFSKQAVENLSLLIQRIESVAKPQIVISSSWRQGHTPQELRSIYFAMHPFAKHIIDKTPDEIPFANRAQEIQYWLNQHPEIKHFVILDDIDERLSKFFGESFIHIHDRYLLTEADVEKVLAASSLTRHFVASKQEG